MVGLMPGVRCVSDTFVPGVLLADLGRLIRPEVGEVPRRGVGERPTAGHDARDQDWGGEDGRNAKRCVAVHFRYSFHCDVLWLEASAG